TPLTATADPVLDENHHWRLISLLSLSPTMLARVEVIKTVLADLNLYHHERIDLQQLDGLMASSLTWENGLQQGQLIRVLHLTVTLDKMFFHDEGQMYALGELLAGLLPYCLTENNWLRVSINQTTCNTNWSFPLQAGRRKAM